MKSFRFQAFAACFLSLIMSTFAWINEKPLSWEFAVDDLPTSFGNPLFTTVFNYSSSPASAHSPAIRVFDDHAQIVWFEGTQEGHEDVVIKSVDINFEEGETNWKAEDVRELFDRQALSKATQPSEEIWTLGNTIQLAEGEKTVLATVVSVGGWAAASIARVEFSGHEVSAVRKLRLSPMLNRSHLVRNSTVRYSDGSIAIPAYFEMGISAFGELVRLDQTAKVADKRRITQGRFAIQPEIVVLGPNSAVALSRNFDRDSDRLIASWTDDGGQIWGTPKLLDLPNPNSPVAAIGLSDDRILMAFNDDPVHNRTLALAVSADKGREWKRIAVLEANEGDVRYPDFAKLPDGSLLLVYSFGSKGGIRAHVFNTAWVDAQ